MQQTKYTLKLVLLKILKRIKLLDKFNFYVSREYNGKKIRIPFINGMGLTDYVLTNDWLDVLINSFVKEDNGAFIDVGVNIGQTLIRVKTVFPDINYIGFEPNSTCVAYSQILVKENQFKNCIIQNCALSTSVQNLILRKTFLADSRASIISELRPNYFKNFDHVLALDYESFFIDKKISFVKIDVEGAEYEVLCGMKAALIKYKPIITCEVLDSHSLEQLDFTQERATKVCAFLKSIDYGIIQLNTNEIGIVGFSKIGSIKITQWTSKSYSLNDYVFYPIEIEKNVLSKMEAIKRKQF